MLPAKLRPLYNHPAGNSEPTTQLPGEAGSVSCLLWWVTDVGLRPAVIRGGRGDVDALACLDCILEEINSSSCLGVMSEFGGRC